MFHSMPNESAGARAPQRGWIGFPSFFMRCLTLLGLGVAAGCAGLPGGSPHRVGGDEQVVVLDARERVLHRSAVGELVKTQEKSDGTSKETVVTRERLRRVCAEPSPDVFSVAALSLGLDGDLSRQKAADLTLGLKLAASMSEQAASIARSQTINILREVMYRTCERYLSGALEEEEFIIQAHRDQQLIVQVLAIEQLTHAYQAQAIALGANATASSAGVTELGIKTLDNAQNKKTEAQAAAKTAQDKAAKQAPAGNCGDKAEGEKKKLCDEATVAAKTADDATVHYEAIRAALAKQGSASAAVDGSATRLAESSGANGAGIAAVADTVLKIVNRTPSLDEFGLTCVVYYRKLVAQNANPSSQSNALTEACKALIKSQWDLQRAINKEETQLIELYMGEVRKEAETIWSAISSESARGETWKKLADQVAGSQMAELKNNTSSFDRFLKYYGSLIRKEQMGLLKAVEAAHE